MYVYRTVDERENTRREAEQARVALALLELLVPSLEGDGALPRPLYSEHISCILNIYLLCISLHVSYTSPRLRTPRDAAQHADARVWRAPWARARARRAAGRRARQNLGTVGVARGARAAARSSMNLRGCPCECTECA